ncbi:MAG: phosphoribosyltransferase family protein [Patescibacteria group bacterium]
MVFPLPPSRRYLETLSADTLCLRAKRASNDTVLKKLSAEALFAYRDPLVRDCIHALKFDRMKRLGFVFADALYDTFHEDMVYEHLLSPVSTLLVIPIPLSRERLRERGFNQSLLIAEHFVKRFSDTAVVCAPHVLVRTRHTEKQALRLGKAEREANVRNCFKVAYPEHTSGKRILLIDDVITTGATMREARRVLLEAGAFSVNCVAIAH